MRTNFLLFPFRSSLFPLLLLTPHVLPTLTCPPPLNADLTDFKHPGGREVLFLARDRFSDATFAFEAHHMEYQRARAIIKKYAVSDEVQKRLEAESSSEGHLKNTAPKLLPDASFYSDLRRRAAAHFRARSPLPGKICLGPTSECLALFWFVLLAWSLSLLRLLLVSPTFPSAVLQGVLGSFLGAFGHNWIHQPRHRWLAYLSLDTIGFSSDGWQREHLLQHHIYTNTPADNHFKGACGKLPPVSLIREVLDNVRQSRSSVYWSFRVPPLSSSLLLLPHLPNTALPHHNQQAPPPSSSPTLQSPATSSNPTSHLSSTPSSSPSGSGPTTQLTQSSARRAMRSCLRGSFSCRPSFTRSTGFTGREDSFSCERGRVGEFSGRFLRGSFVGSRASRLALFSAG